MEIPFFKYVLIPLSTLYDKQMLSIQMFTGHMSFSMFTDNVKELWLSDLLPGDRKLIAFEQRPLHLVEQLASGNKDSRDKRLMVW